MSEDTIKAPTWFTVVAAVLLVWNLLGVMAYISQVTMSPEALAAFQKVVSIYPRSQKVPDALLKIGYCDYELGYWDAARAALTRVTNEYPDTTAAHLAQRRMEQMTGEGH